VTGATVDRCGRAFKAIAFFFEAPAGWMAPFGGAWGAWSDVSVGVIGKIEENGPYRISASTESSDL
jgi:hypothetical protein